jgi:hypothetical protein
VLSCGRWAQSNPNRCRIIRAIAQTRKRDCGSGAQVAVHVRIQDNPYCSMSREASRMRIYSYLGTRRPNETRSPSKHDMPLRKQKPVGERGHWTACTEPHVSAKAQSRVTGIDPYQARARTVPSCSMHERKSPFQVQEHDRATRDRKFEGRVTQAAVSTIEKASNMSVG